MKVIFVDDEQLILSGLKRALFKTGWQIKFAKTNID